MHRLFLLLLIFLTSCTPQTSSVNLEESPQLFTLYSTSTAESFVPLVYDCAARTRFGLVARTPNIDEADISLRIGAVENGYKIGEIELVIVNNAANPVEILTIQEINDIFTGKIVNWAQIGGDDASITLWVYDKKNDLQVVFNETMLGAGITSTLAHQAQNTREMRREIAQDTYAIGISTQAEAGANLRVLHSFGKLPILAVSKDKSKKIVFSVISCLQED